MKSTWKNLGVRVSLCSVFWVGSGLSAKNNRFQELLKPIDLVNLYEKEIKMTSKRDLYTAILGR
ncbi:MAG: hypothetical protein ACKOA8_08465, partial [Deltaproteobacteria bacterium]